jgi:hypothetical protein
LPTIAYFLGISVRMYYNDHDPPHFHVRYQGFHARVLIAEGVVIDGRLPTAIARVVQEWTELRAMLWYGTGVLRGWMRHLNESQVWNDDRRNRRSLAWCLQIGD